jgi:hypothetical protein
MNILVFQFLEKCDDGHVCVLFCQNALAVIWLYTIGTMDEFINAFPHYIACIPSAAEAESFFKEYVTYEEVVVSRILKYKVPKHFFSLY